MPSPIATCTLSASSVYIAILLRENFWCLTFIRGIFEMGTVVFDWSL